MHNSPCAAQDAAVALPVKQLVSPVTLYPVLHAKLQRDPEARLELHVPRLPLVGALREHAAMQAQSEWAKVAC